MKEQEDEEKLCCQRSEMMLLIKTAATVPAVCCDCFEGSQKLTSVECVCVPVCVRGTERERDAFLSPPNLTTADSRCRGEVEVLLLLRSSLLGG